MSFVTPKGRKQRGGEPGWCSSKTLKLHLPEELIPALPATRFVLTATTLIAFARVGISFPRRLVCRLVARRAAAVFPSESFTVPAHLTSVQANDKSQAKAQRRKSCVHGRTNEPQD
eukprot:1176232-Prorocentrum_minimum.AAC.1